MGRRKQKRLVEFGKDLLIVFLALSAVYLTLRSQVTVDLSGSAGLFSAVIELFKGGAGTETVGGRTGDQPIEVRPLRMTVNLAEGGTYGVQYDTAAVDKLFDKMFNVLGEALSAAQAPVETTEQVWRSALTKQTSVYFDFQGAVPLAALYAWTEAAPVEALAQVSVRRLLLAEGSDGALTLYYSNEDTGMYYACGTSSALSGHLQTVAAPYAANVNSAAFAFEYRKGDGYEKLAPYVLLPGSKSPARQPVYRASNPVSGSQNERKRVEMIEALGFHPQANTSYVAGGKQVVREGSDTLSVYDSGAVDYHSSSAEEPKYPVGDGGGNPSVAEMMEATQRLAEVSAGALCGDARTVRIYLRGITDRGDGSWQVDYCYQINGATVQLGSEGFAARFIVSGGQVSDFYLMLRAYTATEEQVSLLPELQAAAAMGALEADGKELRLAYVDNGAADTIYPGWIAE